MVSLTVSNTRNMRELLNPPRIVKSSDDANFPLYISCTERMAMKRKNEYSMELPGPAIDFILHNRKSTEINLSIESQLEGT